MPLPDVPWTTSFPTAQDTVGVEQPNLTNESAPGAGDGHSALVEHVHALRDKAQALAELVGDDSFLPAACLRARLLSPDVPGISAGYREILPVGSAFPTSDTWWTDATPAQKKIFEQLVTYTGPFPTTIVTRIYDPPGVLARSFTDVITYSGPFEATWTRS